MNHYFFQNKIISVFTLPKGYKLGNSFSERNEKLVPLTAEQVAFYQANNTASVSEIYACKLFPHGKLPPYRLRENAYNQRKVITYNNKQLTITEASQLVGYYFAENNTAKVAELQSIIEREKNKIRTEIPD